MTDNNKQQTESNGSNNYGTDKKRSKLKPTSDTHLTHNTLGKEKSKYS